VGFFMGAVEALRGFPGEMELYYTNTGENGTLHQEKYWQW
jgi:hypothetical protein